MGELWLGLAFGSALLLGACGNEAFQNTEDSKVIEENVKQDEFAEIDAKMHEYMVTYVIGNREALEGMFYEGDLEKYSKAKNSSDFLPSEWDDIRYYFQYRNVGNNYEVWRTNLYEEDGLLLYVLRYHHERTDSMKAAPFVAEKIDDKWQIRYGAAYSYSSPKLEIHFPRGKVKGPIIKDLIELYPEQATKLVTFEETKEFYDGMTEEKRIELQPYFDAWESYNDWLDK
ncbi:hypothetical protein AAGS61_17465 [Lysinibacillus sp. KU-BSD001]|uniref:hypothetical protein n=1 Tax=Lysinibacillus sp. KU-BSD001 TaxID=3141328 RepID=UPI0036E726B0